MAELRVDLSVTIFCECGAELSQIGKIGYDEITVKSCEACRELATEKGYEKGKEEGEDANQA